MKDAAPRIALGVAEEAWDGGGGTAVISRSASQMYPEISPVPPSSHELFSYFLEGSRREQKIMVLSCIVMVRLILFSKSIVHLPLETWQLH